MMREETLTNVAEYKEHIHLMKEAIFRHLSEKDAKDWHVQFSKKMETVKNFEAFYHSFMIGVLEVILPHDKHNVVQPVIDLHKNYQNATKKEWLRAEARAEDAAMAAWELWGAAKAGVAWAVAAIVALHAAKTEDAEAWGVAMAWTVWIASWQQIRDIFLNADGGK